MRYTIPSGLTLTNVIRSRPGTGSIPTSDAPERSGSPGPSASPMRVPPLSCGLFGSDLRGSRRARPGLLWSPEPLPPNEVAVGGSRSRPRSGLTMAGERVKASSWRRHRVHNAYSWVEHQFRKPIQGKRKKVESLKWRLKSLLPCFRISLYF